jgi:hypothetical protein
VSGLILPDVVEHRMALEHSLEQLGAKRERAGWLRYFDQQLQAIDPKLSLVKARDEVYDVAMIPGFWHVRRENGADLQDTFLPITGPGGQFIEPHSGVLDGLRSNDLQRPGALDELRKKFDREDAAREAVRQSTRAELNEEFALRYKAKENRSVLFSDEVNWRNSLERS